ncbi:MAG: hypothetical protein AAGC64_06715 [Bacteroidota bacterium]
MKFLTSNNRIKRWTWTTMLLAATTVGMFSCSDSENDVTPEEEVETAQLVAFNKNTPNGTIYYMAAYERLPDRLDASQAVELGTEVRTDAFGEHAFTFNPNAGTITKWEFNKVTLEPRPIGILSIASVGFSGNINTKAFVSETQAYVFNLNEGTAVKWNPQSMEITEKITFQANPLVGVHPNSQTDEWAVFTDNAYVKGENIIIPIAFSLSRVCCDVQQPGANIAVFNINDNTIKYNQDQRSFANGGRFIFDENENMYVLPERYNPFVNAFYGQNKTNLFTYLKIDDNGGIDPNFGFKLDEALPDITMEWDPMFVRDNKLVTSYFDNTAFRFTSWDTRYDIFSKEGRTVAIDLDTKTVEPFDGYINEGYPTGYVVATIDGVNYHSGIVNSNGVWSASLQRENSFGNHTDLTFNEGGYIRTYAKLW